MEDAGVDPHRHAERDVAGRAQHPSAFAQGSAHPVRGPAGARGVILALEQQQDGVAAPLDEAGTVPVGDLEQLGEDVVEQIVHLLRAHLALARETFRQLGEPRDIGECERAGDLANPGGVARAEPIDEQTRHVGSQRFVHRLVDRDSGCSARPGRLPGDGSEESSCRGSADRVGGRGLSPTLRAPSDTACTAVPRACPTFSYRPSAPVRESVETPATRRPAFVEPAERGAEHRLRDPAPAVGRPRRELLDPALAELGVVARDDHADDLVPVERERGELRPERGVREDLWSPDLVRLRVASLPLA